MTIRPELVLDAKATLGECPSWDQGTATLTWVDITGERVHRFDPATGDDRSWPVGAPVGAAATCASGRAASTSYHATPLAMSFSKRGVPSERP